MSIVHRARSSRGLVVGGRIVGAALIGWSAAIHLELWSEGYRHIATIGVLFLLQVISGGILALALLAAPNRFLSIVSALGALFMIGSLGALVVSLTVGLFGFTESPDTEEVTTAIAVESAGFVVLSLLIVLLLDTASRARGVGNASAAPR
jgi:hypothetical protein